MQHAQQQQPLLAASRPVQGLSNGLAPLGYDQAHAELKGEDRKGLALHSKSVKALQCQGFATTVCHLFPQHRTQGSAQVACGVDQ